MKKILFFRYYAGCISFFLKLQLTYKAKIDANIFKQYRQQLRYVCKGCCITLQPRFFLLESPLMG